MYYAIQKAEKSADIRIFGDIVPSGCEWDSSEVSGNSFAEELKSLEGVEKINVHIDSYGGSVSEGWVIYNALRQCKAKITTYGDGFVASAALYPFLAGDERIASDVSAYFLHQVICCGEGYAEDLRRAADEAEKMTEIGINAFVERAGMNPDTVRELMARETWLTPAEAVSYGIATQIADEKNRGVSQSVKSQIISQLLGRGAEVIEEAPKEERKEKEIPKTIFNKLKGGMEK